jgi:hypothetical protein
VKCSIPLINTHDENDYEEAIMIVAIYHDNLEKIIEHELNINETQTKKDKDKEDELSKHETLS